MGFIDRELARLNRALDDGAGGPRYYEIYAAQQALAWVLEPTLVAPPLAYLTGSAEASADCWADSRLGTSSDNGPSDECPPRKPWRARR